jgi:hypothetical protein
MFSFVLAISSLAFRVAAMSSSENAPLSANAAIVNILKRRCDDLEEQLALANAPPSKR